MTREELIEAILESEFSDKLLAARKKQLDNLYKAVERAPNDEKFDYYDQIKHLKKKIAHATKGRK